MLFQKGIQMGFGCIFSGFIFLFNPNYNIFDILPDFFGYILILYGLIKLRDLAPAFNDARKIFIKLLIVSGIKIGVGLILPGLNDQGYIMVFTFVFVIFELIYMFPAMGSLFEGMFYIGTVYDSEAAVKTVSKAKTTSLIFVVVHGVFTLLPEFVYLYVDEEIGYVLAAYKMPLSLLALLISGITGVAWLAEMRSYFKKVKSDEAFINRLSVYYDENIFSDYKRRLFCFKRVRICPCIFY